MKENIKAPRHWPLCVEFTGTGEFPAQMASNAENVSIWWRHHGMIPNYTITPVIVKQPRNIDMKSVFSYLTVIKHDKTWSVFIFHKIYSLIEILTI